MIDAIFEGFSRDNPLPPDPENEALMEVATVGSLSSIMWWFSWLDSLLTEGARASTVGRCLRKKRNIDFLLGELDVVGEIPDDDDTLKQTEGMNE